MNIRRLIAIDKYFYEIIEDYREASTEQEKDLIFRSFCDSVWASPNRRHTCKKAITFRVRKDLQNTELGQVFTTWSEVEYRGYKALSRDLHYTSLLRQKINNLYTRYFDKEVILQAEYMDLLKTPKRLYLAWIGGTEMSADEVTSLIDDAIAASIERKAFFQKQKIDLSWSAYKTIIEDILRRAMEHCTSIDDYDGVLPSRCCYDFFAEENFYIKYFCRYLECEMKQWQRRYYGVRSHKELKRCTVCGGLMEKRGTNQKYCNQCRLEKRRETNRRYHRKTVLKSS